MRNPRFVWTAVLLTLPEHVLANSAIPGPLIWMGSSMTVDALRWILVCMTMCVLVEGAIYHYLRLFHRPYLASLWLNSVSLVVGVPLSLLGVLDPTWFVLPTLVSALIEGWLACRRPCTPHQGTPPGACHSIYLRVLLANVITNLIMVAYLYVAWKKAVGWWPPPDYFDGRGLLTPAPRLLLARMSGKPE